MSLGFVAMESSPVLSSIQLPLAYYKLSEGVSASHNQPAGGATASHDSAPGEGDTTAQSQRERPPADSDTAPQPERWKGKLNGKLLSCYHCHHTLLACPGLSKEDHSALVHCAKSQCWTKTNQARTGAARKCSGDKKQVTIPWDA